MKVSTPNSCIRQAIYCLLLCGFFFAACTHNGKDYEAEAKFYHNLDDTIFRRFNIDKPKETIQFIDSTFRSLKDISSYGHYYIYNRKRTYYNWLGDNNASDLYADSAVKALDQDDLQQHYPEQYAYALLSKGGTAFALHNYTTSYDYYYRAVTFAKRNLDVCKLKDYSYAVAMTLYSQKKFSESANNFKQAFDEYSVCKDNKRDGWHMQEILNNTALCYTKLNQSDSALLYYNKALAFIKNTVAPIVTPHDVEVANAVIYGNMGKVYFKKNLLDSAEILLTKSINVNLMPGYGDHKDAQMEQVQLANLYLKKNEPEKLHQTLLALKNEFSSKEVAEDAKIEWLSLMSKYYEMTNDKAEALPYYKGYIAMRDSVNEVNKQAFQTDILQQLKDKQQQIQIDTLKSDNQLSHIYLWISITLALMALTIIAMVYYYYNRSKHNVKTLTMLNHEVGEQKGKLEFTMVELEKSNTGKDRILKAVAHDLRNPIGGIAMLSNVLITDHQHDEEEEKSLKMIESTAQNALKLINELLEINIREDSVNLQKQAIELNDFIRQIIPIMRLNAEKKSQDIQMVLLPKPLTIDIDKEKIERVLSNLVNNAIKFSSAGGSITIELQQKDGSVFILVKDKGIGIPVELQANLFNTFSGTMRQGTEGERSFGLGLSICKQIVEAHGGKIWVQSTPGNGTTVFVELPV